MRDTVGPIIAVLTALAALTSAIPAWAQGQSETPAPVFSAVDANGVDLASGAFTFASTDVVIGQPGAGGLTYSRSWWGGGWLPSTLGRL